MSDFEQSAPIVRPPTVLDRTLDRGFRVAAVSAAVAMLALLLWIVVVIAGTALPAVRTYGVDFLTSTRWDPGAASTLADVRSEVGSGEPTTAQRKLLDREEQRRQAGGAPFGALPAAWGTLYSSLIALLIGGGFGVAIAIFLTEDFLPGRIAFTLRLMIELLAAIPSVVFGLWGIVVLIPALRPLSSWLAENVGTPLFADYQNGAGMLPAGLVLGVMILPTVAAVAADALRTVPERLREGAVGLGATRWEALLGVVLPAARNGIVGAIVLGFGRALGETMAVAMLMGNRTELSVSLLAPANTLAGLIANQFNEAGEAQLQALMYAALVLMAITLTVNVIAAATINAGAVGRKGT